VNAIDNLLAKATQGEANAQNQLGFCYSLGKGVKQDFEKAAYWYTKAAEQGHSDAQNQLASYYWDGTGVKRDREKAVYWWKEAAERGNPGARDTLRKIQGQTTAYQPQPTSSSGLVFGSATERERADIAVASRWAKGGFCCG
jgi:TPR repeat protein